MYRPHAKLAKPLSRAHTIHIHMRHTTHAHACVSPHPWPRICEHNITCANQSCKLRGLKEQCIAARAYAQIALTVGTARKMDLYARPGLCACDCEYGGALWITSVENCIEKLQCISYTLLISRIIRQRFRNACLSMCRFVCVEFNEVKKLKNCLQFWFSSENVFDWERAFYFWLMLPFTSEIIIQNQKNTNNFNVFVNNVWARFTNKKNHNQSVSYF